MYHNLEGLVAAKTAELQKQNNELLEQEAQLKSANEEFETLNEELVENIKKAEEYNEQLAIAKEKAEESDRLKTAFLQNMSHEIRTPMNAICGFSEQLSKTGLSVEKRNSYVSIIQNSSQQLLGIIKDILTISSIETKQEKANISKVCINCVMIDLLAIFKQEAMSRNSSLVATQALPEQQSEVYTDKTKVTQILTNLLTNAFKFTHQGSIEFGYNLITNQNQSQIEFYVKDTGIGISTKLHEKIFERFRQADNTIQMNYGGTGLGLSISKGFVELLGGKIWVQSEPEKGASFYFSIPYKPAAIDKEVVGSTIRNSNTKTILIAEDEVLNFLLIEEYLIDLDIILIHAKQGHEAVEICKSNPNIDLILMDIKMPIMDGHTAAKLIKEFKPDLPIIAQSGYALDQEIAKYNGAFDDYLTKPIREEDFKKAVLKYINR
jgi:signal transduction histidine kinase